VINIQHLHGHVVGMECSQAGLSRFVHVQIQLELKSCLNHGEARQSNNEWMGKSQEIGHVKTRVSWH
jgi:hypothetical protein